MALGFSYEEAIGDAPDAVKAGAIDSPGYYKRLAQVESNNNPNAKNPKSSASGLYQITAGTRAKYGDDIGALTNANKQELQGVLGRDPNEQELYLAHQQGAGGAKALLSNPDENAIKALVPAYNGNVKRATQAVVNNGGNPNMSAGDFAKHVMNYFGGAIQGTFGVKSAMAATNEPFSYEDGGGFSYEDAAGSAQPQPPDLSLAGNLQSMGRTVARGARNVAIGAVGGLADLPAMAYNAVTGTDQKLPSEDIKNVIDTVTGNALQPQDPAEQFGDDASQFFTNLFSGSALFKGVANVAKGVPLVRKTANVLAETGSPKVAAASAAGYAGGKQLDENQDGVLPIGASILSGLVAHDPKAALNMLVNSAKVPMQTAQQIIQSIQQNGIVGAAKQAVEGTVKAVGDKFDKSPYKVLPDDEKMLADTIEVQGIDAGQTAAKMQQARQKGYTLPMAEAAESPALRGLGSDVASTTEGSKVAKAAYENAAGKETSAILQKITERAAGRPGTVDDYSQAFQEGSQQIINNAVKTRSDAAKKAFIGLVKKGTNVNISPVMKDPDIAKQIVDSIKRVKETNPSLAKAGYNDIRVLHLVQQDLNSFYKEAPQIVQVARNKAFRALVGQMEKQLPDYKIARNEYKSGAEHIKDLEDGPIGIISDLGKQNFDDAGKKMLNMPASSVAQMRKQFMTLKRGKNGLTGAETFDGMVASAIGKMVGEAATEKAGALGAKLLTPERQAVIRSALNPTKAEQVIGMLDSLDSAFDAAKSLKKYTGKSEAFSPPPSGKQKAAGIIDLAGKTIQGRLAEHVAAAAKENLLNNPTNVQNLGKYLFTQEGEQFLRKMASIKNAQQKQAATAALTYKLAKKRIPAALVQAVRNTAVGSVLLNSNNYQGENNAVP